MDLFLGTKGDDLTVFSTSVDLLLTVTAGEGNDKINITGLQGDATVYGDGGEDELYVDGRAEGIGRNTLNGTDLNWNGGLGQDYLEMQLVGAGTTNLNLFGDGDGPNTVVLLSTEVAATGSCYAVVHMICDADYLAFHLISCWTCS